jgi:hypothetical protein
VFALAQGFWLARKTGQLTDGTAPRAE